MYKASKWCRHTIWELPRYHFIYPHSSILKKREENPKEEMHLFQVIQLCTDRSHREGWARKNWCFWIVVLETTLESPLDCKEIKPVNPKVNQSRIFIGRTSLDAEAPILWPPDTNSRLIGKDPDAGKDWRQKEEGAAEDELVRQHHQLNGHDLRKLWVILKDSMLQCAAVHESQRDLI